MKHAPVVSRRNTLVRSPEIERNSQSALGRLNPRSRLIITTNDASSPPMDRARTKIDPAGKTDGESDFIDAATGEATGLA